MTYPGIRLQQSIKPRLYRWCGRWCCTIRGPLPHGHFFIGHGNTPQEAYQSYLSLVRRAFGKEELRQS